MRRPNGAINAWQLLDAHNDAVRAAAGIHHRAGRAQRLRYVFLTGEEADALRALAARGVAVTAQDVPSARVVPLEEVLSAHGED